MHSNHFFIICNYIVEGLSREHQHYGIINATRNSSLTCDLLRPQKMHKVPSEILHGKYILGSECLLTAVKYQPSCKVIEIGPRPAIQLVKEFFRV